MMHHVGLPNQPERLAPAAQRKLRYICSSDRLPPSIISTRSSRPTSLIVLTLRLMICTPAAICHDHATTWLLTISLTSLVRIAIPRSHKHTAARERAESFRGCCHNNTNSSGQHRASNKANHNSFFDIEKPHKANMPCGVIIAYTKKVESARKKIDKKSPDFSGGQRVRCQMS